ncbi:hypothetical protein [Peribacillus butanolivorans]
MFHKMFHQRALSEISATAIFLASKGAAAITGEEIGVTGGM